MMNKNNPRSYSLSNADKRIISAGLDIVEKNPWKHNEINFLPKALVVTTLPHRPVSGNEYVRKNGRFTLSLMSPSHVGLPYGSVPRLLMFFVSSQAVINKSPEVDLGDSLSGFMRSLGLIPSGGRWGSINRLKEQTKRLFCSTISFSSDQGCLESETGFRIADCHSLWWNPKDPDQVGLWSSYVKLTDGFYREILDSPVPLNLVAIKALKQSPLALDIYGWLTHRLYRLRRKTLVPWNALQDQFGCNYAKLWHFQRAFTNHLHKVHTLYPQAKYECSEEGIYLMRSPAHVPVKRL